MKWKIYWKKERWIRIKMKLMEKRMKTIMGNRFSIRIGKMRSENGTKLQPKLEEMEPIGEKDNGPICSISFSNSAEDKKLMEMGNNNDNEDDNGVEMGRQSYCSNSPSPPPIPIKTGPSRSFGTDSNGDRGKSTLKIYPNNSNSSQVQNWPNSSIFGSNSIWATVFGFLAVSLAHIHSLS
jgi:hypothetical protein